MCPRGRGGGMGRGFSIFKSVGWMKSKTNLVEIIFLQISFPEICRFYLLNFK